MAELKEIHIGFKKTVADGSYGNETHEARLTVMPTTTDDGVDVRKVLELFATILEDHVNSQFRQSRNENIRYAMETAEEREARYKREAAGVCTNPGDPDADSQVMAASKALYLALAELVALKALKDGEGKTADYEARQPAAWEAARAALALVERRV